MNFKNSQSVIKIACRFILPVRQDLTYFQQPSRWCSSQIVEQPKEDENADTKRQLPRNKFSAKLRRKQEEAMNEPNILLDPNLSDEDREKIRTMKAEYEVWKYADAHMPEYVTNEQWKIMLNSKTTRERIFQLNFFSQKLREAEKEIRKENERQLKIAERRKRHESEPDPHIIYGQGHNAIIRRLESSRLSWYSTLRALNASAFGTHIVFDMSFLNGLSYREQSLTLEQIAVCVELNRAHRQCASLAFTGLNIKSGWYSKLKKYIPPDGLEPLVPVATEKSYLDLYPRDKLVYLSPDSQVPLKLVDRDKVYIIGAFVDKVPQPRLTLGRAKSEGIATCRLPLEEYIKWESGSKYLCLNHVLNLLLDVDLTGDWYSSIINNVPKRKITKEVETSIGVNKRHRQTQIERVNFLEGLVRNK